MNFLIDKALAVQIGVKIPLTDSNSHNYNSYIYAVLKFAINVGLILSILMIVYGGIKYMLSQGNQSQIGDAKDVLISAIIGFSLLLMIALVLKTLGIPLKSS